MSELDKIRPGVKTVKRQCKQCGQEFDAHLLIILKEPRDISGDTCPACRAKTLEEIEKKEKLAEETEIARRRRALRSKIVPTRYLCKDFSNFDYKGIGNLSHIFKVCLDYAEKFPINYRAYLRQRGTAYRSMLLYSVESGETDGWGVGKTHLACAIAHRLLDRWRGDTICPIQFISEPELYRRLQATYNYSREERNILPSEDEIIKELIWTPLLILDDVGKEERKDPTFVQRILFAIINGRYNSLNPILMTTNKNKDDLNYYMGNQGQDQASINRLIEMCGGIFVQVKAPSYRTKVKDGN